MAKQKQFRNDPPQDRLFTLRKCPFCGKIPELKCKQLTTTVAGYQIQCSDDTHCAKVVAVYEDDVIKAWGTEYA